MSSRTRMPVTFLRSHLTTSFLELIYLNHSTPASAIENVTPLLWLKNHGRDQRDCQFHRSVKLVLSKTPRYNKHSSD